MREIEQLLQAVSKRCPVCGDPKPEGHKHCFDCQAYSMEADQRRKEDARRKAFGGWL